MRYLIVIAALMLASTALAHPHADCPKDNHACDQHRHPGQP